MLEIPGAAEVVLGAGPADRRPFAVAIEVELDLALAPPAVVVHAPGQIGADVLALAVDAIEEGVDLAIGQRVVASPLGVEIGAVLGDIGQGVIDRVVEERPRSGSGARLSTVIRQMLAERHLPVAVEAAGRIDRDRERVMLQRSHQPTGEEIADRDVSTEGVSSPSQ